MPAPHPLPLPLLLRRGWRRRCLRCGEGPLFTRWIVALERCPSCGLQYQRNQGDIWIWVILTDRLPIMAGVVAVYFGFQATNASLAAAFFVLLAIPLIATMRQRQGLAFALDYIWRIWMPDPSDEIHGREYVIPSRPIRLEENGDGHSVYGDPGRADEEQ